MIKPDWPAPDNIKAISTTRKAGVSVAPYASLNLALHVGDLDKDVRLNRDTLERIAKHPVEPLWLNQTHSTVVVEFAPALFGTKADASFTRNSNQTCVVMTADCLPVLLCSKNGDFVAAVHAGWRGLVDGILEKAVQKYPKPDQLLAWIGPAISQKHFEVGHDVKDLFLKAEPKTEKFFIQNFNKKYLADLPGIAEMKLTQYGVEVYQSGLCSYEKGEHFFSYRRDGVTGRMASMIWMES